jgi:predicted transcriptional regulator
MEKIQEEINRLMGVSEETWEKYNPGNSKNLQIISLKNDGLRDGAALQKFINELMGISEETWQKYNPKS